MKRDCDAKTALAENTITTPNAMSATTSARSTGSAGPTLGIARASLRHSNEGNVVRRFSALVEDVALGIAAVLMPNLPPLPAHAPRG